MTGRVWERVIAYLMLGTLIVLGSYRYTDARVDEQERKLRQDAYLSKMDGMLYQSGSAGERSIELQNPYFERNEEGLFLGQEYKFGHDEWSGNHVDCAQTPCGHVYENGRTYDFPKRDKPYTWEEIDAEIERQDKEREAEPTPGPTGDADETMVPRQGEQINWSNGVSNTGNITLQQPEPSMIAQIEKKPDGEQHFRMFDHQNQTVVECTVSDNGYELTDCHIANGKTFTYVMNEVLQRLMEDHR